MVSLLQPARALVDPVDGIPAVIEQRRWGLPLVALMAAMTFSAFAFYLRWDASSQVIGQLMAADQLSKSTEADIADAIAQAEHMSLVAGIAKGVLLTPILLLVFALLLKMTGWLLDRPAQFSKAFTVAALALLPAALFHLVLGATALFQHAVTIEMLPRLVPSSLSALIGPRGPRIDRLLSVLDFFNLWSAGLLGLGFAEATGMRKGRGLLLGLVLYLMWAGVFLVAIPGMAGGGKGP